MVETTVEIARCGACSADIRDGSLYCYNCGAAVTESSAADEIPAELDSRPEIAKPESRPPLRSAASLRKQRRAFNRQPVRVSWEQPDGSPKAFIITTIAFVLGAAILLVLALYLR